MLRYVVALVIALSSAAALAQPWPQRSARIIVPYAPGGNTDAIARLAGERLSSTFGQPFIVENRAGAAGLIAAEYVAKSAPDGYTLFMATLTQIVTAPFTNRIAYDPLRDFAPISIIGTNPFVIAVSASLPVESLRDFIEYVRARPGQLNYGSGGSGGLTHLSGALFVQRAGLQITHIPYKGGAPALADLLGGQVQMYSGSPSELIGHAKAGRIKLLGISSEARSKHFPDVPAIAEFYPGHVAITWNGLMAPAATPAAIVEALSREIQKAMREPAFLERMDKMGVDPVLHTPAEFADTIRKQTALWRDVIQSAGIKPE